MKTKINLFDLFVITMILILASSVALSQNEKSFTRQFRRDGGGGVSGKLPTTISKQPWTVALIDSGASNAYDGQFCGGALIDPQWVVTAAHCVEALAPGEVDVLAGQTFLSGTDGARITVDSIHIHPEWNSEFTDNDIALLKLSSPVSVGTPVEPISLDTIYLASPGTVGIVSGWGLVPELGNETPDQLQEVSVPIASQGNCGDLMGDVSNAMFCAGNPNGGADSCEGDSGGPLVVSDGSGGWALAGLVSWGGEQCGAPGSYGVYTDVADFHDWIASTTNGQSGDTNVNLDNSFGLTDSNHEEQSCVYLPENGSWKCDSILDAMPEEFYEQDNWLEEDQVYYGDWFYQDSFSPDDWQNTEESWYFEDAYEWEPFSEDEFYTENYGEYCEDEYLALEYYYFEESSE